ncbi:MAG: coenzyme F390 synthetase, partial [Methanoregula sp.]
DLPPLPAVGEKVGTLHLNYDTEDTSVVVSREKCACGRTHMRIMNPTRESETIWIFETPFNRVDIEKAVFQPGNMEYLTGEYEAFLYGGEDENEVVLRVSMEAFDPEKCDKKLVQENFLASFLEFKPRLVQEYAEGSLVIDFNITSPGALELYRIKGRPKRLVDRRG